MPIVLTCVCGHCWEHTGRTVEGSGRSYVLCPACRASVTLPGSPEFDLDPTPGQDGPLATPPRAEEPFDFPGYVMLARLEPSGMGVVYRARQVSLNRVVALKTIRSGGQATPQELARFRREAEAVARLDHPHIVRIYDFGEHGGLPYFSMEYVEGGTLAGLLAGRPLPPRDAAGLLEVVARAVHYAHGQGIVHRDLKPANILLASGACGRPECADSGGSRPPLASTHAPLTGRVPKVADFGLAKRLDADSTLSHSGAIMGTPCYMSPEQAGGRVHEVGPWTDVWALGAILYECLAGRPPFKGATRELTISQVLHDDPTPPTQVHPRASPELEAVCLKCLRKEAHQRYAGAAALADDLRRFLDGEALSVRPESEWDRQVRWARRAGYELRELIGCSAAGLVFHASQINLGGRPVTLKTVSAQERLAPDRVERFRAEARVAAHLDHPNIARIYDFDECQGRPFFSLEYVGGGRLSDRCRGEPQPPRDAAALVQTLAEAAHCAHEQGIVHGDLRPFNVLLTPAGVPKITGFGLGRLLAGGRPVPQGRRPGRGLSNYMAPEQAAGRSQDIGPATDVHALGAILYEMLTGQPPFLADTVEETLDRILTREAAPPAALQRDVPGRLEAICLRCLAKDPRHRYASARALADDLKGWLRGAHTDEFDLVPGYELLRELGRGGMGVVYEARQVALDRVVALKFFRERLDRVLTAIRAAARLAHPNLVQVFDCGERDGLLYVAEELVAGTTLAQRLADGPLPPDEAARLLETLARALHHVHAHGIIHRNLKPRVVLLSAEGVPKVGSFDLAVLPGKQAGGEEGVLMGTPAYMAPEQLAGDLRRITPATDVHALGAILYEMLTGVQAFPPGTEAVSVQVQSRAPQPPSRLRPDVPRPLEWVCLKCLQKDPAHRYRSAADLADDLRRFLDGKRVRPGGPGLWRRLLGWFRLPH